jgi:FAD:protein FMN transferase
MKYISAVIALFILLQGCNQSKPILVKIEGNAQGTTYHISYLAHGGINLKAEVDSILRKLDSSLSTYLPVSIISRVNQNDSLVTVDEHFEKVFNKSREVSVNTIGAFDITIAPLVNAWGFGFSKKENVDSLLIDSLLPLVDYKKVALVDGRVAKQKQEILIDFNAIAQGYSVDVLASFLSSKGIENFLVELGGEIVAKGKKNGDEWQVGIDLPVEGPVADRTIGAIIPLLNRAMATSGNYRKFYEEDGRKYAHILDPKTGYPARREILSATVLAPDAMTADAYATAFMVMGLKNSEQFLKEHPALELDVYFVYDDAGIWKTYTSNSKLQVVKTNN